MLLRDLGIRKNYRIDLGGQVLYLKVHGPGWRGSPVSPGFREWKNHLRLRELGFPTPQPLACGKGPGFSFFMSRGLDGTFGDEAALAWAQKQRTVQRRLTESLALLVKRFHALGFFHRDLYLCHVVVDEERVFLIDRQRVGRSRLFRKHRQIKDLAALLYSSMDTPLTRTERLRFFKAYWGGTGLNGKARRRIRAVEKKARRIAAHHLRKIPQGSPRGRGCEPDSR